MEDDLKHIYNACEPYVPAPAEYYYDCAEARGSSALSQEFQNHLRLAKDYLYFLFTGHIGCGKSSELKQLERALLAAAPPYHSGFWILTPDSCFTLCLLISSITIIWWTRRRRA